MVTASRLSPETSPEYRWLATKEHIRYGILLELPSPISNFPSHNTHQICFKDFRYASSPSAIHHADRGWKRIKGALDARIAEEQARQKAAAQTPSRSASISRRSSARNTSPSKRPLKAKDADNGGKAAPSGKGPDPSEFDPDFVIGEDDDQPSRVGTPRPKEKADASDEAHGGKEKDGDGTAPAAEEKAASAPDIPPEVQTRLRRLDKLEPKYSGMGINVYQQHLLIVAQSSSAHTASPMQEWAPLKHSRHNSAKIRLSHP